MQVYSSPSGLTGTIREAPDQYEVCRFKSQQGCCSGFRVESVNLGYEKFHPVIEKVHRVLNLHREKTTSKESGRDGLVLRTQGCSSVPVMDRPGSAG